MSISSKYEDMHRTYSDLYEDVFDDFVRAERSGGIEDVSLQVDRKTMDKLFAMDKQFSEEYVQELKAILQK